MSSKEEARARRRERETARKRAYEIACRIADGALERLDKPRGWVKGTFSTVVTRKVKGEVIQQRAFCMIGAIREAEDQLGYREVLWIGQSDTPEAEGKRLVRHALANAIRSANGTPTTSRPSPNADEEVIATYNDASKTVKQDVLARMADLREKVCR